MAVDVGTAVGYLDLDISGFLAKLREAQDEAGKSTQTLEQKLNSVGSGFESIGQKMALGITAPITGAATVAVKTAADFEGAMSQVQATMGITKDATAELNGETVNTMEALESLAKDLGAKTAFSAMEAAEGLNYMALAGYDVQQAYDALPTVLNLASAGAMELATASDMVTDVQSALGLSMEESAELVNKMAKASSSSNTSVEQLGNAILTVGGTAKTLAGGTTELSTALGILANNGVKGAEGGTALRNVILSLSAPTDKAAKELEALGVKAFDESGNLRPLEETFGDLNTALSSLTQEGRTQALNSIFNKVDLKSVNALLANTVTDLSAVQSGFKDSSVAWTDYVNEVQTRTGDTKLTVEDYITEISTFLASMASAGKSAVDMQEVLVDEFGISVDDAKTIVDSFNHTIDTTGTAWSGLADKIDNAGNAAEEMAKTQLDNLQGQITLLKSAVEGMAISFGELMLPAIKKVVEWIQKGVDWINSLNDSQREAIIKIAAVIAAIGPLLIIVGKVISGVSGLISTAKKIGEFTKALGNIPQMFSKVMTAIGGINPVVVGVVAAIAVLVLAFKHLWETNEEFRNKVTAIWKWIVARWEEFTNAIKERLANFGIVFNGFGDILETVKKLWSGFCDFLAPVFTAAFNTIANIFGTLLDVIIGILDVFIGLFTGNWEQFFNGIKEIFEGIWNGICRQFETNVDFIKDIANVFFGWFGTSWEELLTGVKEFFVNIWENIKKFFSDMCENIKTGFVNFIDGVVNFFATLPERIAYIVGLVIGTIARFIVDMWNNAKEVGPKVIETIVNFFKELPGKVWKFLTDTWKKFTDFIAKLSDTAKDTGPKVIDAIVNFFSGLPGKIKAFFTQIINDLVKWGRDMRDKARNAIKTVVDALVNGIKSAPGKIKQVGRDIISGLYQGIIDKWNSLKDKVAGVWGSLISGVKKAFDSHSPSKIMRGEGHNLIDGLGLGVVDREAYLREVFGDMAGSVVNEVFSAFDKLYDLVAELKEMLAIVLGFDNPEGRGGKYTTMLSTIIGYYSNMRDYLASCNELQNALLESGIEFNEKMMGKDSALSAFANSRAAQQIKLDAEREQRQQIIITAAVKQGVKEAFDENVQEPKQPITVIVKANQREIGRTSIDDINERQITTGRSPLQVM